MLEPGVVVSDRYRIVRLIGEGGMGAVFEAEHTGIERRVAIKVLHADYTRKREVVERFQREAKSAAAIGHENIIDVLDAGVHEGAPYIVMEFLNGESLQTRLERLGKFSVPTASVIVAQVLSALAAAHAVGIVHRDLKPDNVFLVPKRVREVVKLLDFGVSKINSEKFENKVLTASGALMGTPAYMAPEQALARSDIDQRADIYSAGVMLYQMVTGQLPFDAESQTELLMQIVYRPAGLKGPREINPDVPPEFDTLVLKAMAKEREDRFADASEFLTALTPFLGFEGAIESIPEVTQRFGTLRASATPVQWEKPDPSASTTAPPENPDDAVPPVTRRPSGRWMFAVGAAGLAAVVLAGIVVQSGGSSARPSTAPASAARLPANVAIDLQGLPPGATIVVDGQPAGSPHLSFPRGSTHRIRVSAPAMQPSEMTVTADRDRDIVVALLAEQPPPSPPGAAAPDAGAAAHARLPAAQPATTRTTAPQTGPANPTPSGGRTRTAGRRGNPLLPISSEF